MKTKRIKINIKIKKDQEVKLASLDGFAFIESGFLSGKIFPTEEMYEHEQVLITAFSFTGCPIAARVDNPDLNPWLLTNGAYKSNRILNSSEFSVSSKLESVAQGSEIHMDLELIIHGCTENLHSIAKPFQESIYQENKGNLRGEFDIVFNTCNGKKLLANANTNYCLDITKDVLPVWRNIVILNSGGKDDFTQVEQIDLFGNKEVADADLKSKTQVALVEL